MASSNATGIILGSSVLITATTVLRNAKEKKDPATTFKPVIFGFGLAFALLGIALVSSGLAKALALMGLVGAFVVNGQAVFDFIGKLGGSK